MRGSFAAQLTLRVVRLLGVLFLVSVLCFFSLALLPGDPARMILGETGATPEAVAALRQQLGLDLPVGERFIAWFGGILQGDFGQSYRNGQAVSGIIASRLPVTLQLIVWSQLIALAMAVPAAIAAATRRRTGTDRALSLVAFTLQSTPNFVVGVLLVWLFAVTLGWLPSTGYTPITEDFVDHASRMIMPAFALATASFALYQRVLRADLIETLQQDFVAVARAKGLSPARVMFRHAMRPSMLGLTTSVGVTVGALMGGTVVIEVMFGIPGLGAELVAAVNGRDYIEVQGLVLVIAATFVIINALVDFLYAVVDPRLSIAKTFGKAGAR